MPAVHVPHVTSQLPCVMVIPADAGCTRHWNYKDAVVTVLDEPARATRDAAVTAMDELEGTIEMPLTLHRLSWQEL